jgi:hypothetical protein
VTDSLSRDPQLTEHVNVRFPGQLAAAAAQLAAGDGMSTSAWVRKIVDCELAARERRDPDLLSLPWRTGRHLGRTVYAQLGPEPSDEDPVLGMLDTEELAAEACGAHNRRLLHAEIREGLAAAERGGTVDLGEFRAVRHRGDTR